MGIPNCSRVLVPFSTRTGFPMKIDFSDRYIITVMASQTLISSSQAEGIRSSLFMLCVIQGTHLLRMGYREAHSSLQEVVKALQPNCSISTWTA